jgi:hypothetical protein
MPFKSSTLSLALLALAVCQLLKIWRISVASSLLFRKKIRDIMAVFCGDDSTGHASEFRRANQHQFYPRPIKPSCAQTSVSATHYSKQWTTSE